MRIPEEGTLGGSYYIVQSIYTHETKWCEPEGKLHKRNPKEDHYARVWGEMTSSYALAKSLGIDTHKGLSKYGVQYSLETLKDAKKLLAACRKADKTDHFDMPCSGPIRKRTRHLFRIAIVAYSVSTFVIPE